MFPPEFVEKIKTRVMCSKLFFFENRDVCEKMEKNLVETERPQMINTAHAR